MIESVSALKECDSSSLVANQQAESVCQILIEARQSQNLTTEDVAKRLRLKPSSIQAIEEGQVDKLPAQPFLIGYVRSYSRLLNLDETHILALWKDAFPAPDQENKQGSDAIWSIPRKYRSSKPSRSNPLGTRTKKNKKLSYGLFFLLLIGALFLYLVLSTSLSPRGRSLQLGQASSPSTGQPILLSELPSAVKSDNHHSETTHG